MTYNTYDSLINDLIRIRQWLVDMRDQQTAMPCPEDNTEVCLCNYFDQAIDAVTAIGGYIGESKRNEEDRKAIA